MQHCKAVACNTKKYVCNSLINLDIMYTLHMQYLPKTQWSQKIVVFIKCVWVVHSPIFAMFKTMDRIFWIKCISFYRNIINFCCISFSKHIFNNYWIACQSSYCWTLQKCNFDRIHLGEIQQNSSIIMKHVHRTRQMHKIKEQKWYREREYKASCYLEILWCKWQPHKS